MNKLIISFLLFLTFGVTPIAHGDMSVTSQHQVTITHLRLTTLTLPALNICNVRWYLGGKEKHVHWLTVLIGQNIAQKQERERKEVGAYQCFTNSNTALLLCFAKP